MKITPMYDRVLVIPLEGKREIGGFSIPDAARQDYKIGLVLSVGEGYVSETGEVRPLRLAKDDKVMFGPFCGTPVQIDGNELLVLREGEIALKIAE